MTGSPAPTRSPCLVGDLEDDAGDVRLDLLRHGTLLVDREFSETRPGPPSACAAGRAGRRDARAPARRKGSVVLTPSTTRRRERRAHARQRLVAVAPARDQLEAAAGRSARTPRCPPRRRTPRGSPRRPAAPAARSSPATAGSSCRGPRRTTRHLDRGAALHDRLLAPRQPLAGRHAQLLDDQVEAGHLLGHRVLDLDARVHLEEVEAAGGVDQELHRAGVDVADGPGAGHRRLGEAALGGRRRARAPATPRSSFWWRRWIEHSRSCRCTTAAVGVGEHLHLDVARALEVALEIDRRVAERRLRAPGGGGERRRPGRRRGRRAPCRCRRRRRPP